MLAVFTCALPFCVSKGKSSEVTTTNIRPKSLAASRSKPLRTQNLKFLLYYVKLHCVMLETVFDVNWLDLFSSISLHPDISIHILRTDFTSFYCGTYNENLYDGQELLKFLIISIIPISLTFDPWVIL